MRLLISLDSTVADQFVPDVGAKCFCCPSHKGRRAITTVTGILPATIRSQQEERLIDYDLVNAVLGKMIQNMGYGR